MASTNRGWFLSYLMNSVDWQMLVLVQQPNNVRDSDSEVLSLLYNRSPVQVRCIRQVLGAAALGWPRGMGWGGRWEAGSGWGTHVNPWLIHVNVWQKPQQYFKVISLQLIKINKKKKKVDSSLEPSDERLTLTFSCRILDREPSYMACRPLTYWNWDIKN